MIWITSSAITRMRWQTRRRPINCQTFIPPPSPVWIRPWSHGTAQESTPVTAARVGLLPLRVNISVLVIYWQPQWKHMTWSFSKGAYIHQAAGIALHPHEWRNTKQRNSTPPPTRRKNYPFTDGGFSEDDWDKAAGWESETLMFRAWKI